MQKLLQFLNTAGLSFLLIGAGYLLYEVYSLRAAASVVESKIDKFDELTDFLFKQEGEIVELKRQLEETQQLVDKHEGAMASQAKFNLTVAQKIKPIITEWEVRQSQFPR